MTLTVNNNLEHNKTINIMHATILVPQLSFSPDLELDIIFFLFPDLKSTVRGRRILTIEKIKEHSPRDMQVIPEIQFQDVL